MVSISLGWVLIMFPKIVLSPSFPSYSCTSGFFLKVLLIFSKVGVISSIFSLFSSSRSNNFFGSVASKYFTPEIITLDVRPFCDNAVNTSYVVVLRSPAFLAISLARAFPICRFAK